MTGPASVTVLMGSGRFGLITKSRIIFLISHNRSILFFADPEVAFSLAE